MNFQETRKGQTFLWNVQGLEIPHLLNQTFPAHMGLDEVTGMAMWDEKRRGPWAELWEPQTLRDSQRK